MKLLLVVSSFLASVIIASAQVENYEETFAAYFKEISTTTDQFKNLWDIDLYGPILIVNPFTRQIYSNYQDDKGLLKPAGTIYSGYLPTEVIIGNTAVEWNGKRWAMILLPYISKDLKDRLNLFTHELFHLSQPELGLDIKSLYSVIPEGFDQSDLDNHHFDKRDGRIYLRLELAALIQSIKTGNDSLADMHLQNALTFRKYRHSLYPAAKISENLAELNEGLASYTGITMSHSDIQENVTFFEKSFAEFQNNPTYVNTFAYQTIPLYGYILKNKIPFWNKQINKMTNLTDFFDTAFDLPGISNTTNIDSGLLQLYNGDEIISEEIAREREIEQRILEYVNKFIELPHVELPRKAKGFSFDTRNVTSLNEYGTVYQILETSDYWGKLSVKGGALVSKERDKITISKPITISAKEVTGEGWTLELKEGYSIDRNEDGNYILKFPDDIP